MEDKTNNIETILPIIRKEMWDKLRRYVTGKILMTNVRKKQSISWKNISPTRDGKQHGKVFLTRFAGV